MKKIYYTLIRCQGDLRVKGLSLDEIRQNAFDMCDGDEIAKFLDLADAKEFLKTKKNSIDFFTSAGMRFANATVYWLAQKIVEIDEDGDESVVDVEYLDAAAFDEENS